ncbi:MAG: RNA-binding protein [Alphaproteobacteria bacterium]|nr:RNA-binding protein [Alphaproteobacteria bacterium]
MTESETEIAADSLDDGPEMKGQRSNKVKTDPMRKCLVTQERMARSALIRFVVGPDQVLVADLKAVLPGRGMWVSASAEALEKAKKKSLFAKAARNKVIVQDDFVEQVEKLLVRRCQELLSLANRAGDVVIGFEKVRAAMKAGSSAYGGFALAARDGAEDGRRKVASLANALEIEVSDVLTAEEIGYAFGRDMVIHAYLTPGGLTKSLRNELDRLAGFRGLNV